MSTQPPQESTEGAAPSPPWGAQTVTPWKRFTLALGLSPGAFAGRPGVGAWLLPLVVVVAVQIFSSVLLQDLILETSHEKMLEQWERQPEMTPEQQDQAWEMAEKGIRISTFGAPLVVVPLGSLAAAVVFLLIINFGLGGSARLGPLWVVSCLAWAPKAVEMLLFTGLAKLRGSIEISFGPAALVSTDGLLRQLLSVLDLFDLWMLGIHFVGLSVLLSMSKRQARTAVLVLWITWWVIRFALAYAGYKLQGA